MIQKNTILSVSDVCGVDIVRCFHVYKKRKNFLGGIGNFIKVSVRSIHKNKFKLKKKKFRSLIVNTNRFYTKFDGSNLYLLKNACVLLKKRLTPCGKLMRGSIVYNIKRKKFIKSFSFVM